MKINKMVRPILVNFFIFMSFALLANAQEEGVGMVTGSDTGTYYRFGQEIAEKAAFARLDILVKPSKGSIENIKRMDSRENAAFAIVQSDVLNFLKRNPNMASTAKKLRLIFPLYKEEVHLFANTSIKRLQDLQGKRVVLGADGSGNWLTAVNVLSIMNITPSETLTLSPPDAVKAVLQGQADAMFYVAGKPVKLFLNMNDVKVEFPQLFKTVHFVPLQDPKLLQDYVASSLSSAEYSWFEGNVATIAVKAALVSFDFSANNSSYYQQRCEQLARLGKVIRKELPELQRNGHPKWQEVNLEERVGNWDLDTCSRQGVSNSGIQKSLDDMLKKTW